MRRWCHHNERVGQAALLCDVHLWASTLQLVQGVYTHRHTRHLGWVSHLSTWAQCTGVATRQDIALQLPSALLLIQLCSALLNLRPDWLLDLTHTHTIVFSSCRPDWLLDLTHTHTIRLFFLQQLVCEPSTSTAQTSSSPVRKASQPSLFTILLRNYCPTLLRDLCTKIQLLPKHRLCGHSSSCISSVIGVSCNSLSEKHASTF